jgi:hypothetical protein
MPVTTVHSKYAENAKKWRRFRDAAAGEDAVKAAGDSYLPKLSLKMTDQEYNAYRKRALYYNATGRTVDGLTGLVFRKDPAIDAEPISQLLDDVTLSGLSFRELAEKAVEEVITVARGGILVDYPAVEEEGRELTVAEIEQRGDRPYATFYEAEQITNWETGRVGNRTTLTKVVLKETYIVAGDDEFQREPAEQYRVLDLTSEGYRQRVFREDTEGNWVSQGDIFPTQQGSVLNEIPFEFLGPREGSTEVQKSPIEDLVSVNLSHYRTMADLENGRHWCGSPTPVFLGTFITEDGDEVAEVQLGSESGIHMDENSEAKFLEFTGGGLEALENAAKQKEEMMAVLGARILAQDKRMVEAAETAQIHRAGESATLASVARAVSKSLTRVLELLRDWAGASGEVSVELNSDFMPTSMDAQTLLALMKTWQSGGIAYSDFLHALKQGELVRDGRTEEEIQDEISQSPPSFSMMTGGAIGNGE